MALSKCKPIPPLAALSTLQVLRSLIVTSLSAEPCLLRPTLSLMARLANSSGPILNPDRNPIMRIALKASFYPQFCAGEDFVEVARTTGRLRSQGFSGVILAYAREAMLPSAVSEGDVRDAGAQNLAQEVIPWTSGTLETLGMAEKGDFVAVKLSGAGKMAVDALVRRSSQPPAEISVALEAICSFAASRGIKIIFDAEQNSIQAGIDSWVLGLSKRHNRPGQDTIVYNTYQTYLRSAPATLSRHLALAKEQGFSLGVKLVRGAYLGHDPRHLMWASKEETDLCFDGIAAASLRQRWDDMVRGSGTFPAIQLCLATHNATSVRKAREIVASGEAKTPLSLAQLQGMADQVSCDILASNEHASCSSQKADAFKYLVWGSTGECMKYLLRRAHENKDALQRTRETRDAMKEELVRRVKALFGFL